MLGVFPSLDPLEGDIPENRSLNRYGYVQGNPANLIDPSGMIGEDPGNFAPCQPSNQQDDCGIPFLGTILFPEYAWDQSLYPEWGITLTAECELPSRWKQVSPQKGDIRPNLINAFRLIDGRFRARASGKTFKDAYVDTEFRMVGSGIGDYASAYTRTGRRVEWNPANMIPGPIFEEIVIHELGHVLDKRTRCAMGDSLDDYDLPGISVVGTKIQQATNPEDRRSELVADYFLNWVYQSFKGGLARDAIDTLQPDSATNLNLDERSVLAYWQGVSITIDGTTVGPSLGIEGWIAISSPNNSCT